MAKVLAHELKSGDGDFIPISSGRYAVAMCGVFDHATVSFRVRFGDGVSKGGIERLEFTEAGMEITELPACLVWLRISGERADTMISAIISPVDR